MESDTRFITRPMSIALDIVRAVAAFVVLAGHAPEVIGYTGPYPLTEQAKHNAVVVFFVLSGLVIANSLRPGATLAEYVIARVTRILPLALLSLAFGSTVFSLSFVLPGAPMWHPGDSASLTIPGTLAPALFLSESWLGSGPVWNPPYWSLCYEVWYYALFAAAMFLQGRRRMVWLMMLACIAGPKILLLAPIWLFGVALARWPIQRDLTVTSAIVALIVSIMAFLQIDALAVPISQWLIPTSGLDQHTFEFSQFFITDIALGFCVALFFVALRPISECLAPALIQCGPIARAGAGMSFTLYLLHWPMLCLLRSLEVNLGDNIADFIAVLIGIVAICAVIARVTEGRQKALRTALQRLVEQRRKSRSTTYA